MTLLAEQTDGFLFMPVEDARLVAWHRLTRFAWLGDIGLLPVADTELLNLAHHCAIAIRQAPGGPVVVCVLQPDLLRAMPVHKDGRWAPPYAPLALRSLPFRARGEGNQRIVEVAPVLARREETSKPIPLFDAAGEPTADYAAMLATLDRLWRGMPRLCAAARLLIAADVLVPLGTKLLDDAPALMTVSHERMMQLRPSQAAALTADACAAFELAAACLFSQRWLAKGVIQEQRPMADTVPVLPREAMFDQGLTDAMDRPFMLDDSLLFSFEDYARATDEAHGTGR